MLINQKSDDQVELNTPIPATIAGTLSDNEKKNA
jgi:hypothetical protein